MTANYLLWWLAAFAASIYCTARGVADLRQKRCVWGIIASASIFILTPIETRAVKIDVPVDGQG